MKVIKFNNYEFPYNPSKLIVLFEKRIAEIPSFLNYDVVQNIGEKSRKITGEGEFFGDGFLEKFKKLEEVYQTTKEEKLVLPWGEEVYAIFNKLKMVGEGGEHCVKYFFEFTEIREENINLVEK